jgi:hypothetical protein
LFFQRLGRLGMRDVIDDDVGALLGQLQNDGHADAAVAAGDDGDFAFKTHIFSLVDEVEVYREMDFQTAAPFFA